MMKLMWILMSPSEVQTLLKGSQSQYRLDFIAMHHQICNGRTKRNSHLHIATMKEGLVNVIKYPLFQPKRRHYIWTCKCLH